MTETIENLFFYLIFLFDLFLLGTLVLLLKKKVPVKELWFIFIYATLNSVVNLLSFLPHKVYYYILGGFTLLEYCAFASFIYFNLKSAVAKKVIIIFSILFAIFVIGYQSMGRIRAIDSVPIGVETILILLFSFYYFYEQLNDVGETFVYHKYHFWIIVGFLIYLGGSFFIYVFANQISRQEAYLLEKYWFLTYVFYIIKSLLFIIGILTYAKQHKSPRPEKLYPYLN